ncbi:MAG: hypothetical protein BECKG1743F_GA0114225_108291 [Candidatus Kentron sp. G]|nr:MAG: hypothetical protein BECKG1743F_GA0114225_108291 [Candidatus Kentron sp. G]
MRLPRALNPNENPAQFGIFFSANRLKNRSLRAALPGGLDKAMGGKKRGQKTRRLLLDSRLIFYGHGCFAGYLPRRGYIIQPRVAA